MDHMIHIIAPSRRHAIRWCRENGHDPAGMRAISRVEQLWGLAEAEKAGQITLRIVFTGSDPIARAASAPR
jgi:hypothetical protein